MATLKMWATRDGVRAFNGSRAFMWLDCPAFVREADGWRSGGWRGGGRAPLDPDCQGALFAALWPADLELAPGGIQPIEVTITSRKVEGKADDPLSVPSALPE